MMNYTFEILDLFTKNTESINGIVCKVKWKLTASKDGRTKDFIGHTLLKDPLQEFIDYGDLDKQMVEAWVISEEPMDDIKLSLAQQFDFNVDLTDAVSQPLPWLQTENGITQTAY